MTATDRLRALLDERGVENVWKFDGNKMWDSDGGCCGTIYETQWESPDGLRHLTFTEYPNEERTTRLVIAWHPTPEQAVAATLGVTDATGGRQDGAGTCKVEGFDDGMDEGLDGEWFAYAPPTWHLSCGHEVYGSERPRYCSTCGRRVVE